MAERCINRSNFRENRHETLNAIRQNGVSAKGKLCAIFLNNELRSTLALLHVYNLREFVGKSSSGTVLREQRLH